jgi:bifunctional ADP-heptose synthase (sugar kinase/adenylyltransferase)
MTFFMNLNLDDLQQFVSPNYMNPNTNSMKFVITGGAVIIDKPIIINKNIGSNRYTVGPRGLMSVNENNRLITMAFTQAQRVREIYERTGDGDTVLASEKISCTTFYRYLALAYLSPRVVNELMSGKLDMPLRDIYELTSKSQDFAEQEKLFLGH